MVAYMSHFWEQGGVMGQKRDKGTWRAGCVALALF